MTIGVEQPFANRPRGGQGDLQESRCVNSGNLGDFSWKIAKIFCGFDEGIAWGLEDSQDGECEIRENGKDLAESGTLPIMAILIPPAVLDEVQAVLDLPVIAHEFLKVARRSVRRVDARDEVARVVRKMSLQSLRISTWPFFIRPVL